MQALRELAEFRRSIVRQLLAQFRLRIAGLHSNFRVVVCDLESHLKDALWRNEDAPYHDNGKSDLIPLWENYKRLEGSSSLSLPVSKANGVGSAFAIRSKVSMKKSGFGSPLRPRRLKRWIVIESRINDKNDKAEPV
jgi:hypothetical protein